MMTISQTICSWCRAGYVFDPTSQMCAPCMKLDEEQMAREDHPHTFERIVFRHATQSDPITMNPWTGDIRWYTQILHVELLKCSCGETQTRHERCNCAVEAH